MMTDPLLGGGTASDLATTRRQRVYTADQIRFRNREGDAIRMSLPAARRAGADLARIPGVRCVAIDLLYRTIPSLALTIVSAHGQDGSDPGQLDVMLDRIEKTMDDIRPSRSARYDFECDDNPSEWDWTPPSVEASARAALREVGRHQCPQGEFCRCLSLGVENSLKDEEVIFMADPTVIVAMTPQRSGPGSAKDGDLLLIHQPVTTRN
jgi:hypothetical protein